MSTVDDPRQTEKELSLISKEFVATAVNTDEWQALFARESKTVQFDVTDGEPFYIEIMPSAGVVAQDGIANRFDVFIESDTTTMKEMMNLQGTSFSKLRKETRLWCKPCQPSRYAWFGMLVRIAQGR